MNNDLMFSSKNQTETNEQFLDFEVGELQCLESCAAQGFTIQDYIDSKIMLIDILKAK